MSYVDGYIIPLPESNIDAYKELAEKMGVIWMEHGALAYKECIADDIDSEMSNGAFRKAANSSEGETVIFAFVVYKSREHRDEVNQKVFQDPRMKESCDENNMPFEINRMIMGGFDVMVDL